MSDVQRSDFASIFRGDQIRRHEFGMVLKFNDHANSLRNAPRSEERRSELGRIQRIDQIRFRDMRVLHQHSHRLAKIVQQADRRCGLRLVFCVRAENFETEKRNEAGVLVIFCSLARDGIVEIAASRINRL